MNRTYYEICKWISPYFSISTLKSIRTWLDDRDAMQDSPCDELWIPISVISEFNKMKESKVKFEEIVAALDWMMSLPISRIPTYFPLLQWDSDKLKLKVIRYFSENGKSATQRPWLEEPIFEHGLFVSGFPSETTHHEVSLYFSQYGPLFHVQSTVNPDLQFTLNDHENDDAIQDDEYFYCSKGFLVNFEKAADMINVLTIEHKYESIALSVCLMKLSSMKTNVLPFKIAKSTNLFSYPKNKVLGIPVFKSINATQLRHSLEKLTAVHHIDMPKSGYGIAYIRLKASQASQLSQLLSREGGLKVHAFSLKGIRSLETEEEKIFWMWIKEKEAKSTLQHPLEDNLNFVPLINKHGHTRSAKSVRNIAKKKNIVMKLSGKKMANFSENRQGTDTNAPSSTLLKRKRMEKVQYPKSNLIQSKKAKSNGLVNVKPQKMIDGLLDNLSEFKL